ncbi:hypothetical protein CW751_02845 [Brumimicrobium salinarum]|uniref:Ig-like domain-containing protein n=1 Tax=Brumimicrobium salinarum TaxID=2058658 RepID=A0A2I0R6T3_9FLAO|nr:gliding motility-associated C-terminal domain-containing protein [Brumimicrobium salinarum]PKR82285.1 hypothetical protein CW751_02845 [Brumimicrobium salinarum]
MMRILILFFTISIFHYPALFSQEVYNNCADAFELCPNKTVNLNNISANATVCSNCEDDFTFCFSGENTIWMTFTTNDIGGDALINFSNITFENLTGQGNQLEAAILEVNVPCVSSSYSLISNCIANGTGMFSLTATALPPNTTYYVVVNGAMGTTDNAEASFDVLLNGSAVDRNASLSIGTNSNTICKGNSTTFYASTIGCDDQGKIDWFANGNLIGTTVDSVFIYPNFEQGDVVTAKVSCFSQCADTLVSNSVSLTVLDFLVDAGENFSLQKGESANLDGQTSEANFEWSPSYNMSDPNVINPVVNPEQTTTYYLTADNGTCTRTDEVTVFVEDGLEIPNTFSPNGDNINDTWEILGIEKFPDCNIQIYTRWGQLVYQTTGYSKDKRWNGESKSGKKMASGAYYYVINLRDDAYEKPIKGTVSLIR